MKNKSRILKIGSVVAGLIVVALAFQNFTFTEMVNQVNALNPGKIRVIIGQPLNPLAQASTHTEPDGSQTIIIRDSTNLAQSTTLLMHELIHAATALNDSALNFQIEEVIPNVPGPYADGFYADETLAHYYEFTNAIAELENVLKLAPAGVFAYIKPPGYLFEYLWGSTSGSVNLYQSLLNRSDVINALNAWGTAKTTILRNGVNVQVTLTLTGNNRGRLRLTCSGCSASGLIGISLPARAAPTTAAQFKDSVNYIRSKLAGARTILNQMNPNSANFKEQKNLNAVAHKLATDMAKQITQNAPPGTTGRVVDGRRTNPTVIVPPGTRYAPSSQDVTEIEEGVDQPEEVDEGGVIYRNSTVIAGDIVANDGSIMWHGESIVDSSPVGPDGNIDGNGIADGMDSGGGGNGSLGGGGGGGAGTNDPIKIILEE